MSMPARSAKDVWSSRRFGLQARIVDKATGSSSTTPLSSGTRHNAPQLPQRSNGSLPHQPEHPHARSNRRPRLQRPASVEHYLHQLGFAVVGRSHETTSTKYNQAPTRREFEHHEPSVKVNWRTGSEGRNHHIKRSYGWKPAPNSTGIGGARTLVRTRRSSLTTSSRSAPRKHGD